MLKQYVNYTYKFIIIWHFFIVFVDIFATAATFFGVVPKKAAVIAEMWAKTVKYRLYIDEFLCIIF